MSGYPQNSLTYKGLEALFSERDTGIPRLQQLVLTEQVQLDGRIREVGEKRGEEPRLAAIKREAKARNRKTGKIRCVERTFEVGRSSLFVVATRQPCLCIYLWSATSPWLTLNHSNLRKACQGYRDCQLSSGYLL